ELPSAVRLMQLAPFTGPGFERRERLGDESADLSCEDRHAEQGFTYRGRFTGVELHEPLAPPERCRGVIAGPGRPKCYPRKFPRPSAGLRPQPLVRLEERR